MLIHIVKTGETVDKIVDSYRLIKSDLISNNLHITDFSHLKSGMKLKIPLLTKDSIETLEETEAFVDDYYPSFEKFINSNLSSTEVKEEVEKLDDNIIDVDTIETTNEEVVVEKKEVYNEIVIEEQSEIKTEKTLNNNVIQQKSDVYYRGNVIPNIDQRFIKKI